MLVFFAMLLGASHPGVSAADKELQPEDPYAAVDGEPIYIGEINWVLTQRISASDLPQFPEPLRQATALLLVRRHLAMQAMVKQGGEALKLSVDRRVQAYAAEAKRRGTSIKEIAAARSSTSEAVIADLAWTTIWSQYLKSKMTEANLRRYFDLHRERYAGGRYDVSQIFVKLDSADAQSIAATTERLQEMIQELRVGGTPAESFAEVARQSSDSPSAKRGGRIGWVSQDGDLPGELMQVVRHTPAGSISDPVRTSAGMHVVLVHEIQTGQSQFDDLTDQSTIRRDAADALFNALVESQSEAKVVWFDQSLKVQPR